MNYTQSFNESTKDDREDAERRMVTVRPVTAGIASKAVINAQSNMTKDDREDAERRLAYAKSVTPTVVQSGMTKDDREDAERRMAYVKPVTAGIASKAVINAQSNMTKNEREALETATRQISPSAQLSSNAPVAQSPYPSASYGGPSGMTKDDREDAERRMATVKPVTAGIASKAVINAQSNKSKEDREISNAYKTPGYRQPVYPSQVRPPATYTPIPNVITASPVIIPGTKDAREAATDWVKLALQVGAAYLLLA